MADHVKQYPIIAHAQSKSRVGILQPLDVALQPVFKPQNFSENLAASRFGSVRKFSRAADAYSTL